MDRACRMREGDNISLQIFVRKLVEKKICGRARCRWQNNIKMNE